MKQSILRVFFIVVLVVMSLFLSTVPQAFAASHSTQAVLHSHHVTTGNPACASNPGFANCDGYDPAQSGCTAGAYWVGHYSNEVTYIQVFWSPRCQSNYLYVYVPSGLSCGYSACNAIENVWLYRSSQSAKTCNSVTPPQDSPCIPGPDGYCYSLGGCSVDTELYYCARNTDCQGRTPFNGGYVNTPSGGWTNTFESDMLYAPTEAVSAKINFINTQTLGTSGDVLGLWH